MPCAALNQLHLLPRLPVLHVRRMPTHSASHRSRHTCPTKPKHAQRTSGPHCPPPALRLLLRLRLLIRRLALALRSCPARQVAGCRAGLSPHRRRRHCVAARRLAARPWRCRLGFCTRELGVGLELHLGGALPACRCRHGQCVSRARGGCSRCGRCDHLCSQPRRQREGPTGRGGGSGFRSGSLCICTRCCCWQARLWLLLERLSACLLGAPLQPGRRRGSCSGCCWCRCCRGRSARLGALHNCWACGLGWLAAAATGALAWLCAAAGGREESSALQDAVRLGAADRCRQQGPAEQAQYTCYA